MKQLLSKIIINFSSFYSANDINLCKRAVLYAKPYIRFLFFSILCIISNVIIGLVQPFAYGKIIRSVIDKNSALLIKMIILLFISTIIQVILNVIQNYLFSLLSNNISRDVRKDMYDRILSMPIPILDKNPMGQLISRIDGDAGVIANIISNQFLNAIIDILRVIIFGVAICKISITLTLTVVFSIPFSMIIFLIFGKILRKNMHENRIIADEYFNSMQETIAGIREIKRLELKTIKSNHFSDITNRMCKKLIKLSLIGSIMSNCSQFIIVLSEAVGMIIGYYLIVNNTLKIEYYIAFSAYAAQFGNSLTNLTKLNSEIQKALVSLKRIFEVLDGFSYSKEKFGNISLQLVQGNLEYVNVNFGYKKEILILKNISFSIPNRKMVAIVGKSGSGKSSIVSLLARFYDPWSGSIKLDGHNISDLTEKTLRRSIAFVPQDPILFNMSILKNVLLAKSHAEYYEVIEACKSAYIHEFIMTLPNKYNTIIGEKGITLSAGQKQRIAIARAILQNAPIIILDEASSNLDNESIDKIKEALDILRKAHSIMIIAHRLLTIIDADIIYILDNGEIAGFGNHQTLIRENNIYNNLFRKEIYTLNK
jgi:ABC-type multidrug transport system fused ATPase/permease subunit